jgi:hypothetical protein
VTLHLFGFLFLVGVVVSQCGVSIILRPSLPQKVRLLNFNAYRDNSRSKRAFFVITIECTWLPDLDVMFVILRRASSTCSFPSLARYIYSQQQLTGRFTSSAHVFALQQCCHSVTAPKWLCLLPRGLASTVTYPQARLARRAYQHLCIFSLLDSPVYLAEDVVAPSEGTSTASQQSGKAQTREAVWMDLFLILRLPLAALPTPGCSRTSFR